MSMHTLSRQVSPPALTTGSNRVNLLTQYTRQKQTCAIKQDSRNPKIPSP